MSFISFYFSTQVDAQVFTNLVGEQEVFLKGNNIEVGISTCGSYGTRKGDFPGSHTRTDASSAAKLGFVADPAKDGWGVGSPNYYGDFFTPGNPVEGWGIETVITNPTGGTDSKTYLNGNNGSVCDEFSISGKITEYKSVGNERSATWTSNPETLRGVSVCQTTVLNVNDISFIVNVKLCNTSNTNIKELYYARSVDPDNDVMLSNNYATDNKIIAQPFGSVKSVVSANGTVFPGAFLALGANNEKARVSIRKDDIALPSKLNEVWEGNGSYSRSDLIDDVNIALAFKFENVPPGQCIEFSYAYVLDLNDLDKAINSTGDNFTILANGIDITSSGEVEVAANSNVNLGIVGNNAYNWVWQPTNGGSTLSGASQSISPQADITYNVTGTLISGCTTKTKNYIIKIKVKDKFTCAECVPSFSPEKNNKYLLSAWVKETYTDKYPDTYAGSGIKVTFNAGTNTSVPIMRPSGPIIDGWQRIEASFTVPYDANNIQIELINDNAPSDVFFDDIRVHPFRSNMKSFVYDPSTQRLIAELDENNYSTRYEYDDEGILIRVKKETERGVMTIKETRNNQSKINTR